MNGDDTTDVEVEVVVLGAGISGLVASSVLLQQGASSILVVDAYPSVGGNHLDVSIGPYTYDVGSLIFQDDSPLLVHFPELMDRYVPIVPTWSRLTPHGAVARYPFSITEDVLKAGPREIALMGASAIRNRLDRRELRSAEDYARHWLGARFLSRSGLDSYAERFCGRPMGEIDLEFATSRMFWIRDHAEVRALLRRMLAVVRRPFTSYKPNTQLARPREGFAHLYAPAVAGLEARGVGFRLGEHVVAVTRRDRDFVVQTSSCRIRAQRVVSTVPLSVSAAAVGLETEPLPTVTLVSLFYSFAGRRGFDTSILYNFSREARWKRLTMYSDFYGPAEGREFFTVEVVAEPDGTLPAEADSAFRQHVRSSGLFDGDLVLEGSHVLTEAYPVYVHGSAARAAGVVAALRDFGIESLGRQGGYRYQPTARASTLEAEAALRADASSITSKTSGTP